MNISFVASPLMKYAFFASLDEINGIFIQKKFEYPLCPLGALCDTLVMLMDSSVSFLC